MGPQALELTFGEAGINALRSIVDLGEPAMLPPGTIAGRTPMPEVAILVTSWGVDSLGPAELDVLPNLRLIAHAAGTVRSFVTDEIWRRGIRVTSAAGANAVPVAEFTLSQIIYCLKHGWQRLREQRECRVALTPNGLGYDMRFPGMPGAYRSTVALLSYGIIARLTRRLLRVLDVDVVVYDPFLTPEAAAADDVRLVSLDEAFSTADVVSCHTPLLAETKGMIRAGHLGRMRPGASFINTARGAIVDEQGMVDALRRRPDLTAVIDVTVEEPLPAESPLRTLPNIILTPHIAGSVGPECRRLGGMATSEVARFLRGERLEGEITEAALRTTA